MNLDELDRILARVCDVIDSQGGDWDATEAVICREFTGEELDNAYVYATAYLIVYAEPPDPDFLPQGGPAFIRGMRDRRRRLVPAAPARPGWGWGRATG